MLVEQRAIVSSAVRHVCGVYGYESVWVVDIMIFDVIIPENYYILILSIVFVLGIGFVMILLPILKEEV